MQDFSTKPADSTMPALDIIITVQNSIRWFLFVILIFLAIIITITEKTEIQRFYLTFPM